MMRKTVLFVSALVALCIHPSTSLPLRYRGSEGVSEQNVNSRNVEAHQRERTNSGLDHAEDKIDTAEQHRRNVVGGYFPADVRDPLVVEAATFAVTALTQRDESSSEKPDYSFGTSAQLESSNMEVLEASQQVVAGKNFKLTIVMIQPDGSCVGAFHVTLWNHFGEISITKWGSEVPCEEAEALLKEQTFSNESEKEDEDPEN